jgi:hypothetical protein
MHKGLSFVAAAIVLVTSVATLVFVRQNRTGSPDATLQLTERELRLAPRGNDETAVMLWLTWRSAQDTGGMRGYPWLDRAKLESLGFDCRVPPGSDEARRYYRSARAMARDAYAVLEYRPDEVPTLSDVEPAMAGSTSPGRPLEPAALARLPRLVAVDAGLDPAALRARYPDRTRFLITQAIVRLLYLDARTAGGSPLLTGDFGALLPQQIAVPREHAALLANLQASQREDDAFRRLTPDPRYQVTLRYGRNLEPWVAGVRKFP